MNFQPTQLQISSLVVAARSIRSTIDENLGYSKEFRCTEMICLCNKIYCCYDSQSIKFKLSSKGLNERTLENSGEGPMSKYRKVLEEVINITSTNRCFRTIHAVATYERTKKGLSYFYPNRNVQQDGVHTRHLNI